MGDWWIPDAADWLRVGGLDVREYPGWLTRSRSSGGYDDIYAIGLHHDASSPSWTGQRSADYQWVGHEFRPVGAFHLDRAGVWWVGAAGATNTQGKGGPLVCSRGTIPRDAGNRYTISIEAANNGVGEAWTQLDSYRRGVAALIRGLAEQGAYNARLRRHVPIRLDPQHPGDVHAHFEWAPTRKIDPAGGLGQYPYGEQHDRYMRWDMPRFRDDVAALMGGGGKGWKMRPVSKRALGRTLLRAREAVRVPIGMATKAIVRVTALDPTGPGWLSLDGGQTTVVDWGANAIGPNAVSGVAFVALDGGHITITAGPASCYVQVDVQGEE